MLQITTVSFLDAYTEAKKNQFADTWHVKHGGKK